MDMVRRRMSWEVDSRVLLLGFDNIIVVEAVLDRFELGVLVLAYVKSHTSMHTHAHTHLSFAMVNHVNLPSGTRRQTMAGFDMLT